MKVIRAIFILVFACAVFVWILNAYINVSANPHIYTNVHLTPQSEAVVIPGASVYRSGELSPVLKNRMETALGYFFRWDSLPMVLSGHAIPGGYSEPQAMETFALGREVPKERIILDPRGTSTYRTIFNCKYKLELKNITVITQRYHLPRALYIARKLGVEANGIVAPGHPEEKNAPVREISGRVKDFFLINFLLLFH